MPRKNHVPTTNRLISGLPQKDRASLLVGAQIVDLPFAEVLCVMGTPIRHVYFPIASFVSLAASVDGRAGLEVGLVGDEGAIGLSIMLGVTAAPVHALVQGGGSAIRVSALALRRALAQSIALRRVLNRYLYVSMAQLAQSVACMRFHLLEARLARWLATTADRAHSESFRLTHELLATQLGVRRVGVTTAAGALQKLRLIEYHRGHITILDRGGLETLACECYRVDRASYHRVLGK